LTIDRENTSSPITGQQTGYIDVQSQLLTFNTHFKLIKSKPVIENLIKELQVSQKDSENAMDAPATNPMQAVFSYMRTSLSRLKKNVRLLFKSPETELTEQELLDQQITKLQNQITISPVRETRLLYIDAEDNDPVMAAQIADLLAKKYIEFDLASRLESSNENLAWLNKEVYAMKKRLEDDEKKFYEYKQSNKVFSLEGKQKVISQKISELNNEYMATKSKRQDLDAKLTEIDKQKGGSDIAYIRSILNNKSIDEIYANLTNLELEMGKLSKVFKAKHPRIQQISEEISKVSAKFKTELGKEIENLRVQRSVLVNREKVMEQSLSEFEVDALDTGGKELKYTILQRNMDTSQKLYDTLVSKIKESGVVSSGATSTVRIVEHASIPNEPVKPNKKKNLLLSIILGIFGGIGLAFFLEYLDQTVRTEEDVQNYLGLPVLSVIPVADKAEKGGYY
jgi:uncharacterized protein involved in exopolysaccharide biosynthesis